MFQKKICLYGSPLGTRLIRKSMHGYFSEKYLEMLGVAIYRKPVRADGIDVNLMVWDLYTDENYGPPSKSYLRGMAGYVIVEDPKNESTNRLTQTFRRLVDEITDGLPFLSFQVDSDRPESSVVAVNRLIDERFSSLARQLLHRG